jgi:hypothetical protein
MILGSASIYDFLISVARGRFVSVARRRLVLAARTRPVSVAKGVPYMADTFMVIL